jgi:periodic tryptophan protein 1
VYVFDESNSNLYVHHDFIVTAYPLDIEWLPFNPLDASSRGNCLAIASFEPFIEIWDLDMMNPIEPVTMLGGVRQSKRTKKPSKT